MEEMTQQLRQQSYMLSMNDAFLITMGAIFVAVLVVLFVVRVPRKKVAGMPKQDHMALEGVPTEEEHEVSATREDPVTEPLTVTHKTGSEVSATHSGELAVPLYQGNGSAKAGEEPVAVSTSPGD